MPTVAETARLTLFFQAEKRFVTELKITCLLALVHSLSSPCVCSQKCVVYLHQNSSEPEKERKTATAYADRFIFPLSMPSLVYTAFTSNPHNIEAFLSCKHSNNIPGLLVECTQDLVYVASYAELPHKFHRG